MFGEIKTKIYTSQYCKKFTDSCVRVFFNSSGGYNACDRTISYTVYQMLFQNGQEG